MLTALTHGALGLAVFASVLLLAHRSANFVFAMRCWTGRRDIRIVRAERLYTDYRVSKSFGISTNANGDEASMLEGMRTRNIALVRSLGADEVIDYTKSDFLAGDARYDVLIDMVGNRALSDCKRILSAGGRYVACSVGAGDWLGPVFRIIGGAVTFLFGGKRFRMLVQRVNAAELLVMRELIEAGKVRPVIERTWALAETGPALRHVGSGHSRGLNIVRITE